MRPLKISFKIVTLIITTLINISCSCQNNIGKNKIKSIFEYDYIDKETMELKKEGVLTSKQSFDSSGHKFETIAYDQNGRVSRKYKYEYDKNGNCISRKEFDKSNQLLKENKPEFDKEGNIYYLLDNTSTEFCDQKGNNKDCKFDSLGNLIQAIRFDEVTKEIVFKTTYTYEYW